MADENIPKDGGAKGEDEHETPDMESMENMMAEMGKGASAGGPDDTEDADASGAGGMDMDAMMSMLGGKGGGGAGGAGGMDMSSIMSMLGKGGGGKGGGKGSGKGDDTEKDESEKTGADGKWHWQQKGEEIQIRIPAQPPVVKKDISVKFKRSSLEVLVRGSAVINGNLGGTVEVDECTWCIGPGGAELQVMLTKQKEDTWPSLLKDA